MKPKVLDSFLCGRCGADNVLVALHEEDHRQENPDPACRSCGEPYATPKLDVTRHVEVLTRAEYDAR